MLNTAMNTVTEWVKNTFGNKAMNPKERSLRFLEEAVELVQSLETVSEEEAVKLVRYVYARPVGDPPQELGGTLVSLLALCETEYLDPEWSLIKELERIHTPEVIEKAKRRQLEKQEEGF